MLNLILATLAVAVLWLARRYWMLRRGVSLLADAVAHRRPFLNDDQGLIEAHPSWRTLASEADALVREVRRLGEQQAGQLTQLETTLGNLQEAVLMLDRNNYILLANKALHDLLPSAGDLLGQRVESVLKSARFLAYLANVREGVARPQTAIEFSVAGRSVWLETTGAEVPHSRQPNGPWILFVLHDITRQKLLETVRKEFVANVSHELKTPLSVIKGYAETLADEHRSMSPADREQFIRTIHRHSIRLAAIVDDLLTLSRLEHDGPAPPLEEHSLHDLMRAIREEFKDRVAATGQSLSIALHGPDAAVRVDPLRMHQVFGNLLDNAQKYTPAGSTIEIGADTRGEALRLWVRDDGPGIPPADLPRIFERFYRVEKGRSREKGGTGLGLSIVKHIVQLHGGRTWAESEPGRGLAILFTLPARPRAADALPPAPAEPPPPAPGAPAARLP